MRLSLTVACSRRRRSSVAPAQAYVSLMAGQVCPPPQMATFNKVPVLHSNQPEEVFSDTGI